MMNEDKIVLPRPCDGPLYADWTAEDYFMKVQEEVDELAEALRKFNQAMREEAKPEEPSGLTLARKGNVFWKSTDVITSVVGLQNILGMDEATRQKYIRMVNESNARRNGGKRFRS